MYICIYVVISSQLMHTQLSNTHHLAHIPGTCALIIQFRHFYSVPQPHHFYSLSNPSPGDNPPVRGRAVRNNAEPIKNGHVKLNHLHRCTRALNSFLYFTHCRAASTVNPLLPNAIFAPNITSVYSVPALHLHPASTPF